MRVIKHPVKQLSSSQAFTIAIKKFTLSPRLQSIRIIQDSYVWSCTAITIILPHSQWRLHKQIQLTRRVSSTFRTARGVHGGQLAIKDETEPSVAAIGQLQCGSVRPDVETVSATTQTPVSPVVRLAWQHLLGILHQLTLLLNNHNQIDRGNTVYFCRCKKQITLKIEIQLTMSSFLQMDCVSFMDDSCGPANWRTLENTPNLAKWSRKISLALVIKSSMICRTTRCPSSSSW